MAMTETERNLDDLCAILDALRSGGPVPEQRLSAMAHRFLASSPEGRGRVDPTAFAELVGSELTGRFIHQGRTPDETQASRMLAAALRRARADIVDRTHFVPCRLFTGQGPPGLTIGPVGFRHSTAFLQDQADEIAADPELEARVESDFVSWDWMAEVTVRGCDRITSRARAVKVVDGALDILRLWAGAEAARSLGRAGAPGLSPMPPTGLWSDPAGKLHPAEGGELVSGDSAAWLRRAHEGENRDWLDRAGRSLQPLTDPALRWPLADRFREAASWFGEAVTESYGAARILAFVTAIERAVVPGDHASVWQAVTRRAAILAQRAEGGALAAWTELAKNIYEIRSQIVHGGLSPFDPEAEAMQPEAAALSRAALAGALSFYEELGLTQPELSAERLERAFRHMEGQA